LHMKHTKTLGLAISLLLGSQASYALQPWIDTTPDYVIYTSGGAAQDKAYGKVVSTTLAKSGTIDTFNDLDEKGNKGKRWTAYYFIGADNLGILAGKKILLEKRIYGAAGYGVVPVIGGTPLEHLNIIGTGLTAATPLETTGTPNVYSVLINNTASAKKYLKKVASDAGFLGVDPNILLKPKTDNYPLPVNELITGKPDSKWSLTLTSVPTTGANAFTVVPTGGLVYGVGVTLDLYKALQAAQKRAGILPSTTVVGSYAEADLPKLNRNVVGSILAGKVQNWEQFKIIDKTDGNKSKSLLDASILTDAGLSAPTTETVAGIPTPVTPVAVGRRNNGAAIGAAAYAKFLNYPATANSIAPAKATDNSSTAELATLPIVKSPTGTGDTGNLLKDWQNGTNVTGYNNVLNAKRWGIAINSADLNAGVKADGTGGDGWRYIKIDGYAPTLENVAAGVYPHWAEGAVLYPTAKKADKDWESKKILLKALADDLGSPTVAKAVNTTQAWGVTGIFATTADKRGYVAGVPFDSSYPVVPFSHIGSDGLVHDEIVPVINNVNASQAALDIQLK
jgi:hypothetical protein